MFREIKVKLFLLLPENWGSCCLSIVITTTEVTELEQDYFTFIFYLSVRIYTPEKSDQFDNSFNSQPIDMNINVLSVKENRKTAMLIYPRNTDVT